MRVSTIGLNAAKMAARFVISGQKEDYSSLGNSDEFTCNADRKKLNSQKRKNSQVKKR